MATVFVMACTGSLNVTTSDYSQWCPVNNRRIVSIDDQQQQQQPTTSTQSLTIAPEPISPQRVEDMQALFLAFLAVLVSVWGLKQLLRLFTSDTEKD
jgi:hypothetical protein